MSWIETFLTRIEARLRLFIEGDASRDGFPRRLHRQLERELILALKSSTRQSLERNPKAGLSLTAPDQFTLVLPAIQAQILLNHPLELDRLVLKLENIASQSRIEFSSAPILRVVSDPHIADLSIQTGYNQPGKEDSATYQLEGSISNSNQAIAERLPNSFLIVNGLTTFPITAPVINIGRDPTNQLRLDDPQISRQHAQLRFIQGRFVIFDLDSHRGTFVNGVAISSRALNPGDVILLAGVPLVYGQESTRQDCHTQELPIIPPPPEVL
ncbi:MAG TPA: FHA domain-containing protein [Anaerolineales bacterium]|nr:FHA domain-containing protein [Anaerolineales bacterium]